VFDVIIFQVMFCTFLWLHSPNVAGLLIDDFPPSDSDTSHGMTPLEE
jgi:hypothetical protein